MFEDENRSNIVNISKFFLLCLFVINFIACIFCYSGLKFFGLIIPYYYTTMTVFLISCFALCPFYSVKVISNLLKTKSFLFFIALAVWIIIDSKIITLMGYPNSDNVWKNYFNIFVYPSFLTFLFVSLGFPALLSFKRFYKFFLLTFYFISTLGIVDFIAGVFNIQIITDLFQSIVNLIPLLTDASRGIALYASLPRATGVFQEPQHLAMFVFFTFPIIFFYSRSKEKLFNNIYLDKFLKKISFPFATIVIFLTQSPIWLVFYSILIAFMYFKEIKRNWKKILIVLAIIIPVLGIILMNINLEETYLNRIFVVLQNPSLEKLIFMESSLATRISSYTNQFIIFLQNPVLGVGFNNMPIHWYKQILNSPIPITTELLSYAILKSFGGGQPLILRYFTETGIIGVLFFVGFIYYLYAAINNSLKNCSPLEENFARGLKYTIVLIFLTSFYSVVTMTSVYFLYFGCAQAMVMYKKLKL